MCLYLWTVSTPHIALLHALFSFCFFGVEKVFSTCFFSLSPMCIIIPGEKEIEWNDHKLGRRVPLSISLICCVTVHQLLPPLFPLHVPQKSGKTLMCTTHFQLFHSPNSITLSSYHHNTYTLLEEQQAQLMKVFSEFQAIVSFQFRAQVPRHQKLRSFFWMKKIGRAN